MPTPPNKKFSRRPIPDSAITKPQVSSIGMVITKRILYVAGFLLLKWRIALKANPWFGGCRPELLVYYLSSRF